MLSKNNNKWYHLYYIWGANAISSGSAMKIGFVKEGGEQYPLEWQTFLKILKTHKSGPYDSEHLVFPHLWVPPQHKKENILISSFSFQLLKEIKNGNMYLSKLTWRELEEIVAELLKYQGLKVNLTKMTRDGGRDIIAKGEFFPGVESTLAVEVCASRKVGITKLSQSLYRNRHYPLLMLATSGKFTSGVIQESKLPENHMRLILKDGEEIGKWINYHIE